MEKIRATQVTLSALKARKNFLGVAAHLPICPYSLAEAMGFDVRFINIPSFEGMYVANQNLILISAERPEGRKRFTCAHEIGHHVLKHGTVIDEIVENGSNKQEEVEADYFASILLMPPSAVNRALLQFGKAAQELSKQDVYVLSKYFGVSYQAFLTHIYSNLKLIPYRGYQYLRNVKLPEIREALCGQRLNNQVFLVGDWWVEKAIDMEVGDFLISKAELDIDGLHVVCSLPCENGFLYEATTTGIARVYSETWSSFVKVSRKKFTGLYQFKYEEEVDE
ncbi:Zn-dependent peptidase ImmA (M78 family) [Alteromonadaceae bacterium 2753L.S.0a.02]|nr:Zn-dependent peptidase ImmA (M78 family) [Alteromonadaceae bacterium 2753L.S.0a.02]